MNKQEALDRFDRFLRLKNSAERTKKTYIMWVDRFLDFHDSIPVEQLTIFDAQDYLLSLRDENSFADRTYNQAVYALRNFFNGVLNQRADHSNLPKIHPARSEKPWFTACQVLELIDNCPDLRLKAAIALSYGSGLRIDELSRIQIKHIHPDKDKGAITVVNSKWNRTRTVHYSALAAGILRQYCLAYRITRNNPDAFLFQDIKNLDSDFRILLSENHS